MIKFWCVDLNKTFTDSSATLGPVMYTLVLVLLLAFPCINGETSYEAALRLASDKLGSSKYDADFRPVIDQSDQLNVSLTFSIIAIIKIDDVTQQFIINGFMTVTWTDELLTWDPQSYGNVTTIFPTPKRIWRPRMFIINTLGKRDLFEDDYSPLSVNSVGAVTWSPGSLFASSCELDLKKYPFDLQSCQMQMCPMGYTKTMLTLVSSQDSVDTNFFSENGEWEVVSTNVFIEELPVYPLTCSQIQFNLKRRSSFFVVNIILPVVLLSFLNILVFTIPVDSGEKIGYGITVLLALSVFMSLISNMVPRSSNNFPAVTTYLFLLLIISVLSVVDTILIVFLHYKAECEAKHMKAKRNYTETVHKISTMKTVVNLFKVGGETTKVEPFGAEEKRPVSAPSRRTSLSTPPTETPGVECNRGKMIANRMDNISFVVFILVWIITTMWYFFFVLF